MHLSKLFTKTSKNLPADETALNAQLLIKAGYVHKEMAGVYSFLPLGLKVLENIKQIVREEMDAIGGQELIMSSLQPKETWQKTNRWDDKTVDIWFKSKLKNGTEVGFGWSHEEPIVEMMKNHVSSYKDLPSYVYQFQTKLRNELRSKSGIMRGREFVMKDMYSASLDQKDHDKFYQDCIEAYHRVFDRLGIGGETFLTFASGGAFTEFSHEFQTICDAGEDTIYLSRSKKIAVNKEVLNDDVLKKLGLKRDELEEVKSAEVGNIFDFNVIKSKEMGFKYTDEAGKIQFVHLGSYGIGISRLMGVLVEKFADDKGIVWPEAVAPAKVYLISVGEDNKITDQANQIYKELKDSGVEVLFDDRSVGPGQKFADAELIGIPLRVVVSEKSLEAGGLEYKKRTSNDTEIVSVKELLDRVAN
ncbi:prolyl-tRNA synthetase [Candidatus Saccharibacteria bacterium]|nr:prolyl-tRNA synthetase [Candidatus Saccharibacteria bacterium]